MFGHTGMNNAAKLRQKKQNGKVFCPSLENYDAIGTRMTRILANLHGFFCFCSKFKQKKEESVQIR
jgi:hypothetical protein